MTNTSNMPEPTPSLGLEELQEAVLNILESYGLGDDPDFETAAYQARDELMQLVEAALTKEREKAKLDGRIECGQNIYDKLRTPKDFNDRTTSEQLTWSVLTLGKIGDYLTAHLAKLQAQRQNLSDK